MTEQCEHRYLDIGMGPNRMCHRPSILDIREKVTGWSKYHVAAVYFIWQQIGMQ